MRLTLDKIRTIHDIVAEEVFVKPWGGTVFVKGLTAAEREAYEESFIKEDSGGKRTVDSTNERVKLVVLTCCDENGIRMFAEKDICWLSQKNSAAIALLHAIAQRLSGMGMQNILELEKNSKSIPVEDSSSG